MGKLIYSITTSLDGYVADKNGDFQWPVSSSEAFFTAILGNVGTFLLGRKMHEMLAMWDTMPTDGPDKDANEFAKLWQSTDKIVYSRSALEVFTKDTKVEHSFDPEAIRQLKLQSDKDLHIGGPNLAGQAIKAGLVDEYYQFIAPIIVGGGNPWLPLDVRQQLETVDVKKFVNGVVRLQYKPA